MYEFNVNYLLKLLYFVPATWTIVSFGVDCITFRNDKNRLVTKTHKELLKEYIAASCGKSDKSIFDD